MHQPSTKDLILKERCLKVWGDSFQYLKMRGEKKGREREKEIRKDRKRGEGTRNRETKKERRGSEKEGEKRGEKKKRGTQREREKEKRNMHITTKDRHK
jgi:hypothetical protein